MRLQAVINAINAEKEAYANVIQCLRKLDDCSGPDAKPLEVETAINKILDKEAPSAALTAIKEVMKNRMLLAALKTGVKCGFRIYDSPAISFFLYLWVKCMKLG